MVDNNNLELRLCISIPLHDSLKTQIIIEFKAKKTLSFLKGLLVAGTENSSNSFVEILKEFSIFD